LHLLESGTVDAIVTNFPAENRPLGNITRLAEKREDILTAAGSRYAPSTPLAELPAHLEDYRATGRRFGFVGKPCDVAALATLRSEDSRIASAFPVLLSFFCAGVPSETGARKVLEALGVSEDEVKAFRYRGNGWPGRATATQADGSVRSMSYHDSWGGILSKHVQHRCKICADGTGKAADLVCADAWESDENGYPIFEERPGMSLIVARTKLGVDLLAAARAAGYLETQPFDVDDIAAIQPGQRERRRALLARLIALRLIGRPIPIYKGLQIYAAARQNPMRRNLRNFLGTLRRAFRSKVSKPGKDL
jgi:coenzyme F420 hydrogenase subunit beta